MVKHANLFRDAVNVMIAMIMDITLQIKLMEFEFEEIVRLVTGGRHGHKVAINFGNLRFVSTAEIKSTLQATALACSDTSSGTSAFAALLQMATKNTVCPVVRSMYPTSLKRPVLMLLGWLVVTDPDPIKQQQSCELAAESSTQLVALGLAAGFILIEIGIPLLLFVVCARRFWKERYNNNYRGNEFGLAGYTYGDKRPD